MKVNFLRIAGAAMLLSSLASCGEHTHTWDSKTGSCTECGEKCSHEYEEGICDICGYECSHSFADGKCTKCGIATMFRWSNYTNDDEYAVECAQKGTVTKIDYSTRAYAFETTYPELGEIKIEKSMYVYTPYGYDTSKKYNVLYLVHGGGENEGYWFAENGYDPNHGYGNMKNVTSNVLDNMIAKGVCDPLIVVTPSFYENVEGHENSEVNSIITHEFYKELQNDIMPLIVSNYSTYATDTSEASLIAARDHQAIAGFSMGSMTTWYSGLYKSLPYFSYYGCYSGAMEATTDLSVYTDLIAYLNDQAKTYPVKYWLNVNGTSDIAHDAHVLAYNEMLKKCPSVFTKGELNKGNAYFVDIKGGLHAYLSWMSALYNSLLVFYK